MSEALANPMSDGQDLGDCLAKWQSNSLRYRGQSCSLRSVRLLSAAHSSYSAVLLLGSVHLLPQECAGLTRSSSTCMPHHQEPGNHHSCPTIKSLAITAARLCPLGACMHSDQAVVLNRLQPALPSDKAQAAARFSCAAGEGSVTNTECCPSATLRMSCSFCWTWVVFRAGQSICKLRLKLWHISSQTLALRACPSGSVSAHGQRTCLQPTFCKGCNQCLSRRLTFKIQAHLFTHQVPTKELQLIRYRIMLCCLDCLNSSCL